jgi:SM-20-related protein
MPIRLNTSTLENAFDALIDSYLENKVGITDHFLTDSLAGHLKANLSALFADNQFRPAGIGNNTIQAHNNQIRRDQIYWLDRGHNDAHENGFFDMIDQFVAYLNSTCYAGITGYEFHYAMYETGSFYKKHLDQFRDDGSRAFSMIMYLNADWAEKDGGELCIYHADHTQMIAPNNGKCVFFKSSELEHEVLQTNQPRLSITGWLKSGSA